MKQYYVKILQNPMKSADVIAEIKNAVPSKGTVYRNAWYMKLEFQQKIVLNFAVNLVFVTTRNHFEIEVMKRSFQSTFGNWRTNSKIAAYVGKYLCMQRPINVAQDIAIYA